MQLSVSNLSPIEEVAAEIENESRMEHRVSSCLQVDPVWLLSCDEANVWTKIQDNGMEADTSNVVST